MHIKNLLLRKLLTLHQSSQVEGVWNPKNIYTSPLKKGLEFYSTSTTSTASGTTNHRRLIRECLESHLPSNYCQGLGAQPLLNQWHSFKPQLAAIGSSSFPNASNIPKVTLLPTKAPITGDSVWHEHCCRLGIKDSTFTGYNLCKYTWEIVVYMVLTGKERLWSDIWLKTPQQAKSTESMMRIM